MGGQAADHGVLNSADCSLRVLDVKKTPKGYYVHTCVLESGIVKVGDVLNAQVDKGYRMAIARNHTATHLLQAALREVLGDHVHQAGSYQDASITHFDFTHFSAVTPEELARVQKIVNDKIYESMNVTVKEMPIEEAKKLGAMALFGEKYGKVVRVVNIEGWSTEFCGGTHVKNTAQIGGFKIVSESSVAAGHPPHRGCHRPQPARPCKSAGGNAAHRGQHPEGQQCGCTARPCRGCDGREQGHEQRSWKR